MSSDENETKKLPEMIIIDDNILFKNAFFLNDDFYDLEPICNSINITYEYVKNSPVFDYENGFNYKYSEFICYFAEIFNDEWTEYKNKSFKPTKKSFLNNQFTIMTLIQKYYPNGSCIYQMHQNIIKKYLKFFDHTDVNSHVSYDYFHKRLVEMNNLVINLGRLAILNKNLLNINLCLNDKVVGVYLIYKENGKIISIVDKQTDDITYLEEDINITKDTTQILVDKLNNIYLSSDQ